ncbi:hypothetical protein GGF37_004143, partial [Kickxella alabastrina]
MFASKISAIIAFTAVAAYAADVADVADVVKPAASIAVAPVVAAPGVAAAPIAAASNNSAARVSAIQHDRVYATVTVPNVVQPAPIIGAQTTVVQNAGTNTVTVSSANSGASVLSNLGLSA